MTAAETPSPTESNVVNTSIASDTTVHVKGSNVRLAYKVTPKRNIGDAYLIGIFFGVLGGHHFYLGNRYFGVLYFFTFGLFLTGYLRDICRMPILVKRANKRIKEKQLIFNPIPKLYLDDAYMLWFPFGILGFHHFYMRRYIRAIIYVWTFGLFGIGWLSDLCLMSKYVKDSNKELQERAVSPKKLKNLSEIYVFAIFPLTGIFGIHHFLLDRPVNGIFYTLTLGGMLFGYVIDIFRLPTLVKRYNEEIEFGKIKLHSHGRGKKHLDSAYVYLIPFGILGAHHYYLGNYTRGVVYTLTFGLMGIFWIIDFFRLPRLVREHNAIVDEGEKMMSNVLTQHSQSIEGHSEGHTPTGDMSTREQFGERITQPPNSLTLNANQYLHSGQYSEQPSTASLEGIPLGQQYPVTPPPEYSQTEFGSPPRYVNNDGSGVQYTSMSASLTTPPIPGPSSSQTGHVGLNLPVTNTSNVTLPVASSTPVIRDLEIPGSSSTDPINKDVSLKMDHTPENQLSVATSLGLLDESEDKISPEGASGGIDHTPERQLDVAEKLGLSEKLGLQEGVMSGVSPEEILHSREHSKENQIRMASKLGITDENVGELITYF